MTKDERFRTLDDAVRYVRTRVASARVAGEDGDREVVVRFRGGDGKDHPIVGTLTGLAPWGDGVMVVRVTRGAVGTPLVLGDRVEVRGDLIVGALDVCSGCLSRLGEHHSPWCADGRDDAPPTVQAETTRYARLMGDD